MMKLITFLLFTALLHSAIGAPRVSNDYYTAFIETLGIDAHTTDDGVDCSRVVRLAIEEFRNHLKTDSRDLDTVTLGVVSVIETFKFELSPKCRTFYGDFEVFMSQYYGNIDVLRDLVERNWETNNAEISATVNHFLELLKLGDDYEAGQTHANALKLFLGISKPNDSKPEIIFGGANFNSASKLKLSKNGYSFQNIFNEPKELLLDDTLVYNLREKIVAEPQNSIKKDTDDEDSDDEDFDDEDENTNDDEDTDDDFVQVVFVPFGDDSDTMDDEDFDTLDIFDTPHDNVQFDASFAYDELAEGQQDEDQDEDEDDDDDDNDGDDEEDENGNDEDEDTEEEEEEEEDPGSSDEYIQVIYVPYEDFSDQTAADEDFESSEDSDEEEIFEDTINEDVNTDETLNDDLVFENYDSPSSDYEASNEVVEDTNNEVNSGITNFVHTESFGFDDDENVNTAPAIDENDQYATHFAHGDEYYGTENHNSYYVNQYKNEYEESDYDPKGISKRLLLQMYFDL